ncbi:MAG: Sensor histidine kinase RcsC [Syntrophus sp. SKADARSKE-3]|nr:Sensor histidine kinase RcsC [Syntrophus sp. SKADARSKE-3]
MKDSSMTEQVLVRELASLKERIAELERLEAEHRQLDDELHVQREILANISEGIQLTRVDDGVIVYANRCFERMFGYDPEELVGKHVSIINAPDEKDPETVANEIIDILKQKGIWTGEIHNIKKNGTPFWCYANISTFKHPRYGEVWICVHHDITERKHAETALKENEELYRSLFDNMLNGFAYCKMIFDQGRPHDFIYLAVNRAFESLTGLKDVAGKKVSEIIPGIQESDKEILEIYGRVALTGKPERLEKYVGALQMWFSLSVYSTKKEHFVVIFDVINERKKAEEELRQAKDNFRRSQDDSPLGVRIISAQGETIYANQAILDIYGLDSIDELRATPVEKRYTPESFAEYLIRREKRKRGDDLPSEYEISIVSKNGEVRHLHVLRKGVLWDGERHYQAIYQDVTEHKRADAERAKLQEQLLQAQKMESVGRLAGGVAHDFNNMLSVILGHAEMAMEQIDPSKQLYADLKQIKKAAERSADLTSRLLAFARKQTISPKIIDLNKTVERMLKMLRRLIGEDINLLWLPGLRVWPVKVYPSQIDQILANLCVNARDAIVGVGRITIETRNIVFDEVYCEDHSGFVPGDYVLLVVSDNGCGMDKGTFGKIFEPFFTTKGVGEGTGLGLATVYGIIKQNNGFINVYSEPGQGTTFNIYLPRYIGKNEEEQADDGAAEQAVRGRETILVVEDEPALLKLTKHMLERLGYQVLTANTPGKAIRLVEEHAMEIHLLMTDVVMPEMNGRDLSKKMISIYPNLKCLFTSGYTADVIAHHGVLEEGVYFIQKPFSRNDLAAKVREVLEQK